MGYNIDLNRIPIPRYLEMLKSQNLLPSRKILLENIEDNFQRISSDGIQTLAELKRKLSSKDKLSAFAAKTGMPENYLTILKREMGSLVPKPVSVLDFPGITAETIFILQSRKIKTSKDVYDLIINPDNISATSHEIGIPASELYELHSLCDLVRINGIGAVAARTIYEGGYKSVAEIANAKARQLLESMNSVNADKQYYKANLGEKDMQFIIDAAKIVLQEDN